MNGRWDHFKYSVLCINVLRLLKTLFIIYRPVAVMGGSDNDISDEDDLMDSLDDDSDVLDDLSVNDENSQDNSADNKVKLKVLYGSMTDVPKEQKNIIRLFISSTFTGMLYLLFSYC